MCVYASSNPFCLGDLWCLVRGCCEMEPPPKKSRQRCSVDGSAEPLFCATVETTCQAKSHKIQMLVKLLDGFACLNLEERSVNEHVSERCPLEVPHVESLLTFGSCKFVDIIQLLS